MNPDGCTSADLSRPIPLHPQLGPTRPVRVDRRYVTAALLTVMILACMEQTVTSTAMPTIIGDLHGLSLYGWVSSTFLLACTISMPFYGRLADALGRKPVILFAISLLAGSSLLASASHSMVQLVAFRGLMGLGAGGIVPLVLTILGDIFTVEERAKVQIFFSSVGGTSALAGPNLGYFLLKLFGWRSIFWVNLPFAVLALIVLTLKYRDPEKPTSKDLDLPGVLALAAGCTAIMLLASNLGPTGWPMRIDVAVAASAVGFGAFYIWHSCRAANPILPPSLLAQRAVGPAMLASMVLGMGYLCIDTYVPLYVQGGLGGGAGAAASVVTPVALTWACSGLFAARVIVRRGFRTSAIIGFLIITTGMAGLFLLALLRAPSWTISAILGVTGFGFGFVSMGSVMGAQDAVAWQQRGIVTSGVQFSRTFGGAVGIGLLGGVLNTLIAPGAARLASHGIALTQILDPTRHANLPPALLHQAQHTLASGLTWVFLIMFALSLLGLFAATRFQPGRSGRAVSKLEVIEAAAAA
jgi:MFS family permease